jgi:hypothetical protein
LRDCTLELWNNDDAERAMQNDAERFRQYAKECRHLAERASKKDKVTLMEIAAAWIDCAEQVERKQQPVPQRH